MTSILEKPHVRFDFDDTSNENLDTVPIPVIDIMNGYKTGLQLTEVAEVLASEAEDIGISPDSDGAIVIGNLDGDHIVIEQEPVVTPEGNTESLDTAVIVASRGEHYRFKSRIENGQLEGFQVAEETGISSRRVEFSGPNGSKLPANAVEPMLHFTEKLFEVVDTLHDKKQISSVAIKEVVEPFIAPESLQNDQTKNRLKRFGNAAISKFQGWLSSDLTDHNGHKAA